MDCVLGRSAGWWTVSWVGQQVGGLSWVGQEVGGLCPG